MTLLKIEKIFKIKEEKEKEIKANCLKRYWKVIFLQFLK
jgi:hypothetical protein